MSARLATIPSAPIRASAFTLIEVLVALAIFAMAAIALGAAYLNVITAYVDVNRVDERHEDVRFARNALLAEADRKKAEEGADFESDNGRRIRWRAEIETTEVADLFAVTFTCEINDPAEPRTREVVQNFRLLRPTWSDAGERETLRAKARDRILEHQGRLQR